MFRLDNKIAVVIGGAGGIGQACAMALASQGAKVVVADMNLEQAKKVAEKIISDTDSEAIAMPVDVGKEESIVELAGNVVKKNIILLTYWSMPKESMPRCLPLISIWIPGNHYFVLTQEAWFCPVRSSAR